MREIWALVRKDLVASVRELEFLLYLLMPVLGAVALRILPGLMDSAPERRPVVVVAQAGEAAVVAALAAEGTLLVTLAADTAAAEAVVLAGDAVAAVTLPPGMAATLGTDQPPTVDVFHGGRSPTAALMVDRAVVRALDVHARPVPAARVVQRYAGGNQQRLTLAGIMSHAALVLSLLFGSLFVVPLGFCEEREYGLTEAVLLSGVSIGRVVWAKIGFGMILTLSASLAVVGISHGLAALPVAVLHLLPAVVCLLAVGLAVSLVARTRKQAELGSAAAMMLLAVPALAGDASVTVAALARWTPTGAVASDLALDLSGVGVPGTQRLITWAVLAVWTAVAFAFAVRQVRRLEA